MAADASSGALVDAPVGSGGCLITGSYELNYRGRADRKRVVPG